MFLSVKELELRKIRFDESIEAGRIDFSGADLEQASPLAAKGTAESPRTFSLSDVEKAGGWTKENNILMRTGGNYVVLPVGSAPGTYSFTAMFLPSTWMTLSSILRRPMRMFGTMNWCCVSGTWLVLT